MLAVLTDHLLHIKVTRLCWTVSWQLKCSKSRLKTHDRSGFSGFFCLPRTYCDGRLCFHRCLSVPWGGARGYPLENTGYPTPPLGQDRWYVSCGYAGDFLVAIVFSQNDRFNLHLIFLHKIHWIHFATLNSGALIDCMGFFLCLTGRSFMFATIGFNIWKKKIAQNGQLLFDAK